MATPYASQIMRSLRKGQQHSQSSGRLGFGGSGPLVAPAGDTSPGRRMGGNTATSGGTVSTPTLGVTSVRRHGSERREGGASQRSQRSGRARRRKHVGPKASFRSGARAPTVNTNPHTGFDAVLGSGGLTMQGGHKASPVASVGRSLDKNSRVASSNSLNGLAGAPLRSPIGVGGLAVSPNLSPAHKYGQDDVDEMALSPSYRDHLHNHIAKKKRSHRRAAKSATKVDAQEKAGSVSSHTFPSPSGSMRSRPSPVASMQVLPPPADDEPVASEDGRTGSAHQAATGGGAAASQGPIRGARITSGGSRSPARARAPQSSPSARSMKIGPRSPVGATSPGLGVAMDFDKALLKRAGKAQSAAADSGGIASPSVARKKNRRLRRTTSTTPPHPSPAPTPKDREARTARLLVGVNNGEESAVSPFLTSPQLAKPAAYSPMSTQARGGTTKTTSPVARLASGYTPRGLADSQLVSGFAGDVNLASTALREAAARNKPVVDEEEKKRRKLAMEEHKRFWDAKRREQQEEKDRENARREQQSQLRKGLAPMVQQRKVAAAAKKARREEERRLERERRAKLMENRQAAELEAMNAEEWDQQRRSAWAGLGNRTSWSVVRVFISSTFNDFHGERNSLTRNVFPLLNERCRARRVVVVPVDLRWGLTAEDTSDTGLGALEHCLIEVEEARPFFLVMCGERYGWIPPNYRISDNPSFEWVNHFESGHSITAMEVYHGFLRKPFAPVHAFMYERDPAFTDQITDENDKKVFVFDYDDDQRILAKRNKLRDDIKEHRYCLWREFKCEYGGKDEDGKLYTSGLQVWARA